MNISNWEFLEIPATYVHQVPVAELNGKINNFLKKHNPDWVFIPFPDRHIDHRTILRHLLLVVDLLIKIFLE